VLTLDVSASGDVAAKRILTEIHCGRVEREPSIRKHLCI
jgi:hypothetical protein